MLALYKLRICRRISTSIQNFKQKTMDAVELLWESAFKGGMFGLIVATILWLSIFLYVTFYYLYIPSVSHTRPVYLQFTSCEDEKGVCSFPSAHVQLTKKQQLLMVGQKYKIFLSLEMPESPVNVELGMFMVCARMVNKGGILVSNSCRSALLHYRSPFLKFIMLCVNLPFFVFGSSEEKQVLVVELYSDFEEHQNHPVTDIYVEVQSRFIELYSAKMDIQAHLTGLRYIMFNWPILSAICGILSNLLLIAFIFSLSWYHLYIQHEKGRGVYIDFIKKYFTSKTTKWRTRRNQGYVQEVRPEKCEKQSEDGSSGSSESEESKVVFKAGTSEDLGFYLDADE